LKKEIRAGPAKGIDIDIVDIHLAGHVVFIQYDAQGTGPAVRQDKAGFK
jgi:hypothetical protein